MIPKAKPHRRWLWRFVLLIAVFVVGLLTVGTLAPEEDFLVYYQPLFFLLVIGLPLLLIGHDLELLREKDPFGGGGSERLARFTPFFPAGIVRFGRGILRLRVAGAVLTVLVVLPYAVAALWRLVRHLM